MVKQSTNEEKLEELIDSQINKNLEQNKEILNGKNKRKKTKN